LFLENFKDYPQPKIEIVKIAFFIESKIVDKNTGKSILPVFFNDNYISILPGETKIISAKINKRDLDGKSPEYKYSGINVEEYRKNLDKLLLNDFVIMESPHEKIEVSPNGKGYNIIITNYAKQTILHSKNPYKDLFL